MTNLKTYKYEETLKTTYLPNSEKIKNTNSAEESLNFLIPTFEH